MVDETNGTLVRPTSEEPRLHQAVVLVSSLISLSHSIRVFTVKWQSVRSKLEDLLSNLTAIENCESNENYSLHVTVESILATLKDCDQLARRCSELSYSGKLLMQSDLDIISSRLDTHVRSISDIYAVSLLKQSFAIVVSRPSVSASRDDLKFYVTDLLSRLKIGSREMKQQALVELNEVIQEDDRYTKIAVETDGLVTVLVNFLDSEEIEIQDEAAKAVSLIAGIDCFKSVLIIEGIVAPLIRVLVSGSELSKKLSARCLINVTENSDNAWSISAHGGVTALLKICGSNPDGGSELAGLACGVLRNIVAVEEIRRFMVDEGAVPIFVKLSKCRDEAVQSKSLDLLQSMANGDESIRKMIVQEGGIRAFVRILEPKSPYSTKTRELAFRGIVNMHFSGENSLNLLINYGFMDHVLHFLRYGEASVQELALKAAFWLSGTSEEAKKAMGAAGFMAVLVKFLDSKAYEIREMAAETLSNMVIVAQNRKKFVQIEQNVGKLVQMLDPEEANSGNQKLLLSILMSLTSSNTARKKIANSGYFKNIEKLAEAEVSDAKKIVKRLTCNRFRSLLNGILHS